MEATATKALIFDGWAWCGACVLRRAHKLCRVIEGTGAVELKCKCGAINRVELTPVVTAA